MEQERKENNQQQVDKSNDNLVDKVGDTNVHPVSDMDEADDNAEVIPPGELGDADNEEDN